MNNIFKQKSLDALVFQVINNLLNSDNLKVAIAQLCKKTTSLQFYYVIADLKVAE